MASSWLVWRWLVSLRHTRSLACVWSHCWLLNALRKGELTNASYLCPWEEMELGWELRGLHASLSCAQRLNNERNRLVSCSRERNTDTWLSEYSCVILWPLFGGKFDSIFKAVQPSSLASRLTVVELSFDVWISAWTRPMVSCVYFPPKFFFLSARNQLQHGNSGAFPVVCVT